MALERTHHSRCISSVVRLDTLWANLDEILCVHLSHQAYISTVKIESANLKIMLIFGGKRLHTTHCLQGGGGYYAQCTITHNYARF